MSKRSKNGASAETKTVDPEVQAVADAPPEAEVQAVADAPPEAEVQAVADAPPEAEAPQVLAERDYGDYIVRVLATSTRTWKETTAKDAD